MPKRVVKTRKASSSKVSISKEKILNSLKFWEQFHHIKLKRDKVRTLTDDALNSVQNTKQTSSFVHGYLIALMRDSKNLADESNFLSKKPEKKFEDFMDNDISEAVIASQEHVVISRAERLMKILGN